MVIVVLWLLISMMLIYCCCSVSLDESDDDQNPHYVFEPEWGHWQLMILIMKMMATMLLIMIIILLAKSFKFQAPTPALVLPVLVKHEFVLRVCFGANVSLHRPTLLRIVIKLWWLNIVIWYSCGIDADFRWCDTNLEAEFNHILTPGWAEAES